MPYLWPSRARNSYICAGAQGEADKHQFARRAELPGHPCREEPLPYSHGAQGSQNEDSGIALEYITWLRGFHGGQERCSQQDPGKQEVSEGQLSSPGEQSQHRQGENDKVYPAEGNRHKKSLPVFL